MMDKVICCSGGASSTVENRVISVAELAQHGRNAVDGRWIALAVAKDGKGKAMVYDVTAFAEYHPAGDRVILKNAGGDATSIFQSAGHGSRHRKTLESYRIGVLEVEVPLSSPADVDLIVSPMSGPQITEPASPQPPAVRGAVDPEAAEEAAAAKRPHSTGCRRCGVADAPKMCSRCRVARYCSPECQAAAWPQHRLACIPPTELFKGIA
ncbi:unnamed protein product [Phaeothamnion confervicola]